MKKAIIKGIKEKIAILENEWVHSYIVEQYQIEHQDEGELAKARLAMADIEKKIEWMKKLLKKESSE